MNHSADKPLDFLRILIVDDEKMSRETLREFLSYLTDSIQTAQDGQEAIDFIQKEEFDLILTDLKMPKADGLKVLEVAKSINSGIQVIIITGFASLETALEAIKKGAYDYITKPFKLEEMEVVVRNAAAKIKLTMENKLLINQLDKAHLSLRELRKKHKDIKSQFDKIEGQVEESQEQINYITENLYGMRSLPNNLLPLHYYQQQWSKGERLAELERLGRLRAQGILSEAEFTNLKRRLLESF